MAAVSGKTVPRDGSSWPERIILKTLQRVRTQSKSEFTQEVIVASCRQRGSVFTRADVAWRVNLNFRIQTICTMAAVSGKTVPRDGSSWPERIILKTLQRVRTQSKSEFTQEVIVASCRQRGSILSSACRTNGNWDRKSLWHPVDS